MDLGTIMQRLGHGNRFIVDFRERNQPKWLGRRGIRHQVLTQELEFVAEASYFITEFPIPMAKTTQAGNIVVPFLHHLDAVRHQAVHQTLAACLGVSRHTADAGHLERKLINRCEAYKRRLKNLASISAVD